MTEREQLFDSIQERLVMIAELTNRGSKKNTPASVYVDRLEGKLADISSGLIDIQVDLTKLKELRG